MLLAFFRNLFHNRRTEQELDDELRSYLELTTAMLRISEPLSSRLAAISVAWNK